MLAVAVGNRVAQDEAGREGAQDDIELEDLRERAQPHQQQDGDADGGLRRRRAAQVDRLDQTAARALDAVGEVDDEQGDGQEGQKDDEGLPGRAGPQQ